MHRKRAELVELRTRHRTRRVDFRGSQRPDEFARYGCRSRWGGQMNRKNVYLSPYVEESLNSKVIKSFVPELRSRKCFSCFGIPIFYVYMLWTFYVRFTYPYHGYDTNVDRNRFKHLILSYHINVLSGIVLMQLKIFLDIISKRSFRLTDVILRGTTTTLDKNKSQSTGNERLTPWSPEFKHGKKFSIISSTPKYILHKVKNNFLAIKYWNYIFILFFITFFHNIFLSSFLSFFLKSNHLLFFVFFFLLIYPILFFVNSFPSFFNVITFLVTL